MATTPATENIMKVKRIKPKLTPVQREAVTLFCKLRAIKAEGMHEIKEAQGGKFYEFHRGSVQFCKLMGTAEFLAGGPNDVRPPGPRRLHQAKRLAL
jgi:hypothetical protein